jgi:hypothetical protein
LNGKKITRLIEGDSTLNEDSASQPGEIVPTTKDGL